MGKNQSSNAKRRQRVLRAGRLEDWKTLSLLQKLSDGALLRAQKFHWQRLDAEVTETYAELLLAADRVRPVRNLSREERLQQSTPVAG